MQSDDEESKECLKEALGQGFLSGIKASVVSGGLYYMAWKNSHFFRYQFNVSARTALVAMPVFYTTYLNIEQHMYKCKQRNEPEYVVIED